jgi:opacity protein-like surface antigen
MRSFLTAAAVLLIATGAHAQVVWVGAEGGVSWEYKPDTRPGKTWLQGNDNAYSVFAGFPVDDETVVRVAAFAIPHDTLYNGETWQGTFRAYTIGVDYFVEDWFGRAVFSAGLGQYTLHTVAENPPSGLEKGNFGWYVGVGEWFGLGRRSRIIAELAMHRPESRGRPVLVTAMAGFTITF